MLGSLRSRPHLAASARSSHPTRTRSSMAQRAQRSLEAARKAVPGGHLRRRRRPRWSPGSPRTASRSSALRGAQRERLRRGQRRALASRVRGRAGLLPAARAGGRPGARPPARPGHRRRPARPPRRDRSAASCTGCARRRRARAQRRRCTEQPVQGRRGLVALLRDRARRRTRVAAPDPRHAVGQRPLRPVRRDPRRRGAHPARARGRACGSRASTTRLRTGSCSRSRRLVERARRSAASTACSQPGPQAPYSELSSDLGYLLLGSLLAQTLGYAPSSARPSSPPASEHDAVADFIVGFFLARIPILLFQAVQAALLPKLARPRGRGRARRLHDRAAQAGRSSSSGSACSASSAASRSGRGRARSSSATSSRSAAATSRCSRAGSGAFILALTLAQALIALMGHAKATLSWARRHRRRRRARRPCRRSASTCSSGSSSASSSPRSGAAAIMAVLLVQRLQRGRARRERRARSSRRSSTSRSRSEPRRARDRAVSVAPGRGRRHAAARAPAPASATLRATALLDRPRRTGPTSTLVGVRASRGAGATALAGVLPPAVRPARPRRSRPRLRPRRCGCARTCRASSAGPDRSTSCTAHVHRPAGAQPSRRDDPRPHLRPLPGDVRPPTRCSSTGCVRRALDRGATIHAVSDFVGRRGARALRRRRRARSCASTPGVRPSRRRRRTAGARRGRRAIATCSRSARSSRARTCPPSCARSTRPRRRPRAAPRRRRRRRLGSVDELRRSVRGGASTATASCGSAT